MRTKFTNSELAHVWAQQSQEYGDGASFFFRKQTIYSYGYHFPIARFIPSGKVLVTLKTYSQSTTRHQHHVGAAITHLDKLYCYDIENLRNNITIVEDKIKDYLPKLSKARKPEKWIKLIMIEVRIIKTLREEFSYLRVLKKNTPYLYDILKHGENYFSDDLMEKVKATERRKKRREEKRKAIQLEKWRNFETDIYNSGSNKAYLRFNEETSQVETSKGIKIYDTEALDLLTTWKAFPSLLVGRKVQYYTINKCTSDFLQAGCHTIKFSEAKALEGKLNKAVLQTT